MTIVQVAPGIWFGSGNVDYPRKTMADLGVTRAAVASPSLWPFWKGIREVHPILFDDDDGSKDPALAAKLLRELDDHFELAAEISSGPIAFLCYAGLNRSALLAGLWMWWHGEPGGPRLVQRLREAGGPYCLSNTAFVRILVELGVPLSGGLMWNDLV